MNAAELLLRPAGPRGDAGIAIECEGERVSRGELRERVARLAGAWRRLGLRPGGVVAVRLTDGIGWVEAWLSVIWAGGVAVGVNPRLPADEWRAACEESGFSFVVGDVADLACMADTAGTGDPGSPAGTGNAGSAIGAGDVGSAPDAVCTGHAAGAADAAAPGSTPAPTLDLATLRAAAGAPIEPLPRREDDPMLWVHSSGTSGRPKAVVHAHRAANHIAQISAERLGLTGDDRLFASSRLFFTYPLVNGLLTGLRLGATLLIDPRWPTAAGVAAFVGEHRPSVLFSVPSLYRGLLHDGHEGHDGHAATLRGSSLRQAVSAGEALPVRLREQWRATTGVPLWDGWGTSETLVLALTAAPDEPQLSPSPGVQVRPADERAAAAGEPTRLLLGCPTLALGYHRRPAADAESFRDGRFCPADLFVREGTGWRFAGREDSLVKQRGRWVDLAQLEEQLTAGVRGLREAALACTEDADGLSELQLYYVAADLSGDTVAAVRSRLAERVRALPPHQRPTRLAALEALPRTPTGKLLRRALGTSREVAAPASAAPAGAAVRTS
ncbi:MAG: AMP-binding protein [Rubrivivax sp.]|nr:AMP-binding protein [Rubrivivax sp.]